MNFDKNEYFGFSLSLRIHLAAEKPRYGVLPTLGREGVYFVRDGERMGAAAGLVGEASKRL